MQTDRAPRVSIITPVYNAERYIERCIRSALDQSFTDWEQIVVDDGSTDVTAELVQRFDDPRIRYIGLPHRGLSALAETYNTALQGARGELIGILEGDDAWPRDKLERQLPSFDDPEVVLSWGKSLIVDGDDRVLRRWRVPRRGKRDFLLPDLFRMLTRWNVVSPALTVLIRKTALDRIGGFRQTGSSLLVDLPTWLMLSALVPGKARFIDQDLGLYRIHTTNTGLLHNSRMRIEHHNVATEVMRELGPEQLRALGWSARDERTTLASASVSRGIAYFQQGDRPQAASSFRAALRGTRSLREFAIALLGYASAITGLDLLRRAEELRMSTAALSWRLSRHQAPTP